MGDNFLQQFIPGPTHLGGNKLHEFEIILKFKWVKRVTRQFYDYKNDNFDSLRDSLPCLPFEVGVSTDVNEHWSNWKDLFWNAVKEHIPIKTVGDKNSPPWIDGEVRHLIR